MALRFFQSRWGLALVAAFSFLGTLVYFLGTALPQLARQAAPKPKAARFQPAGPSWTFHNPEMDQLIDELRAEKKRSDQREQQLTQFETRLQTERGELTNTLNSIKQLQKDFDDQVTRVQTEEVANLKKLAKTYAAMEPAAAVTIMKELDDESLVKILVFMKESETAAILQSLAQQGDPEAKRAANLSEKLRLSTYRSSPAQP